MSDSFVESETAIRMFDAQLDAIRKVLAEFPEEKIWDRPAEGVVSLGNLVCHVAGSMREWLENGLGQGEWDRDREYEFTRDGGLDREGLGQLLEETRAHVGTFLDAINEENWGDERQFRDKPVLVREILWHQVAHVANHAGQAAFLRWQTGGLARRA